LVVNDVPEPNGMPPVETYTSLSFQLKLLLLVAVPESQTAAVEVEVIVGNVFTVAITSILGMFGQFPFLVSIVRGCCRNCRCSK
jgi:hypothetical protein